MKRVLVLLISVLCVTMIFTGCTGTKELSAAQIDEVNAAFAQLLPAGENDGSSVTTAEGAFKLNPVSHFFTSFYASPEALDLGHFVYYIPRESYVTAEDHEEIAALKAAGADLPFETIEDSPVPFGRIPFSTVDDYLKTYANKTLADMTNMGSALYLEEYKTFYSYASDFGPGLFSCIRGEVKGDIVTLYSEDAVLTLQRDGEHYYMVSHLPVA